MQAVLREFSPPGMVFSFILAIFPFCFRADNTFILAFDLQGTAGYFIVSFLAGTLLSCLGLFFGIKQDSRSRYVWILLGLVCGSLGLLSAGFSPALPLAVGACGAGFFLSFGLIGLLYQWGLYYSSLSLRGVLLNTVLAFLCASVLWYCLMGVDNFILTCLGLFLFLLCGSLPLFTRSVKGQSGAQNRLSFRTERKILGATARRIMVQWWGAIVGIMFNFFTIGLTFWPAAAGLEADGISPKPFAYAIIVIVICLVIRKASQMATDDLLGLFCKAALPIAAAIVLASPFLESVVPISSAPAISSISYVGIALLNVLGLVVLFWLARDVAFPFYRLFSPFCVSCACSMLAGLLVFQAMGKNAQVISLCILAAYLVLMVLTTIKENHAKQGQPKTSEKDRFITVCADLAEHYRLSPREVEILGYLARGHGAKYIAEKLCISAETVRTHSKRIYEKMSIHTKEELLEIIESHE